jgi:nucleoside-diphosphate-sugar epimerase
MKDISIWITGSTGFIGKHLVIELKHKRYNIKCFSNNSKLNLNNESVPKEISYLNYHSKEKIKYEIKKFGCPDVFIHLGWGGMTAPMSNEHLTDNVKNGEVLIETMYSEGLKKFVFIGSMNEYGSHSGALSEDLAPKGRVINYAKAKTKLAKFGFNRAAYYGKLFIHPRPFYVYGPGQRKGSLINELFESFCEDRDAILSPCEHFRDYIYVQDVVDGIIRLTKINTSNTVNLGTGSFIKVKDYVELFWKTLGGRKSKLIFGGQSKYKDEPDQPKSYADLTILKQLTNWQPAYSLEDGIENTISALVEGNNYD